MIARGRMRGEHVDLGASLKDLGLRQRRASSGRLTVSSSEPCTRRIAGAKLTRVNCSSNEGLIGNRLPSDRQTRL